MITGDNNKTANSVGKKLNIEKIYSEKLPDEKVQIVEKIKNSLPKNGVLMYIGDGINDAPSLVRSDIGVSMGGIGSDAAIEASDIVIMNDSPSKIISAIKIAKYTRKIVWQNISFSFIVKFIILLLGVGGMATIWEAVFADVGVALIAILNSIRALNYKP